MYINRKYYLPHLENFKAFLQNNSYSHEQSTYLMTGAIYKALK